MATIEEIRRISIIASTQGAAAATTQLNQLAAAQTNVATTATGMGATTNTVGNSVLSTAAKVDRLRTAHDAAYASSKRLESGQRTVMSALNQGGISADMAANTLAALQRRYGTVATAAHGAAAAHNAHAGAMNNSRMAAMELEHSVRAMADGLAAGANPLRLFSMEFSRLSQAASMSPGGVGGMFRGAAGMFAPMLRPLMSPLGIGAAFGLGAGALGAYAFGGYETRLGGLQRSLNGNGRMTGLTLSGLNNLALGSAGGLTSSAQAQEAVAALAATGRISPDVMRQMVGGQGGAQGLIEQYSRATGTSFSESTKTLAADFADPTKGAQALNKEFGLLGDRQLMLIRNFEASGQTIAAQGVLLGALKQDLAGAVDRTWTWAKAWDAIASGASNALAAVGKYQQSIFDPTLADKVEAARAGHAAAVALHALPPGFNPAHQAPASMLEPSIAARRFASTQEAFDSTANADDLNEQLRRQGQQAAGRGKDFDAKQASIGIGDITRELIPDILQRADLENQRNKLLTGIGTGGALDQGGVSPSDAGEALGRLNARLANFATSAQKVAEDSNLAAAATMARSEMERTAIEAQKAWLDIMRQTGDPATASASAVAKWNEAIAETQHRLDEETRQTARSHAEIGMRPVQREQYEILNRGEDFKRDAVFAAPQTSAGAAAPTGSTADYIRQGAIARGIDPNIALRVAQSEGLGGAYAGDHGSSFGPFQLHYGGVASGGNSVAGLGDAFTRQTGLDARDPSTVRQQIDFSLDQAKSGGWGPWHGAAGAGIGDWQGIGGGAGGATATPAGWPVAQGGAATHAANVGTQASDVPTQHLTQIVMAEQDAIDAANRSLATQKDTWGQMPSVVAAVAANAKLLNDEISQGIPITQKVLDVNKDLSTQSGTTAGAQAQQQQQLDQINGLNDMARSLTSGSLGDIANDFSQSMTRQDILGQLTRTQQNAYYTGHTSMNQARMEAAQRQIQLLASKTLINFGVGEVTKGIFGSGSVGSNGYQPGLLGGLLTGGAKGLTGMLGFGGAGGVDDATQDAMQDAGLFHSGGIVGRFGPTRYVDPSIFVGAPRFHDGGLVAGERPIIAKDGEGVFTAAQMKAMGSGGGGITIHHAPQTNIVVQGDVSEKTMPMIQAAIAQNNAVQVKNLQRTINQVSITNAKLYG